MARVTVEDCAEVVPSRFELVALAAQRAKIIASGGQLTVDRDNDKDAVVALREIADGNLDVEALRELVVQNNQESIRLDEFGVEDAHAETKDEDSVINAQEVEEEISSHQVAADVVADDQTLLYGDNIDADD
jgi:DNA-directed RNA polymerase subunit omega